MKSFSLILKDAYWWVMHRFHPRHRYHVVKTSLPPGYYDPKILMLYTWMNMMTEFVEETKHTIDWESEEGHKEAWRDLQTVHHWWNEKYPIRKLPEEPFVKISMLRATNPEHQDDPSVIEYWKYAKLCDEIEEQWRIEEQQMLERLLNVRPYLWYP